MPLIMALLLICSQSCPWLAGQGASERRAMQVVSNSMRPVHEPAKGTLDKDHGIVKVPKSPCTIKQGVTPVNVTHEPTIPSTTSRSTSIYSQSF